MASTANNERCNRSSAFALGLFGIVIAVASAGCSGQRLFHATNLPPDLMVPPTENAHAVDLSRLANYSVSSELIERGDVIEVTISTGYESDKPNSVPVRVAEDGTANLPLLGKVPVAGLELDAAEQAIGAAAVQRGVYRTPNVTVVMKNQRMNKITVIGAVETPGVYDLPRSSSGLLAALVAAGGLSEEAGTDIEIRRPALRADTRPPASAAGNMPGQPGNQLANFTQPQPALRPAASLRVNLVQAAQQGSGAYYLEDGDVVMVEKRDLPPVHVIGLVEKPGQFDVPANRDLHMLDAVALAGGLSTQWANKVHVIRRMPGHEEPAVIEVNLREAKRGGRGNLRLAPGDVVSVEQTPATVFMDALKSFAHFTLGASVPIF